MRRYTVFELLIALGALLAIFGAGFSLGANKFGTPSTIVHVVTILWKEDATAEQKRAALDGVKTMAAEIPGIKNVWIKATKVQGQKDGRRYNDAFVIEFEDKAAADRYVDHPAHKKWEEGYLAIREQSTSHQITN